MHWILIVDVYLVPGMNRLTLVADLGESLGRRRRKKKTSTAAKKKTSTAAKTSAAAAAKRTQKLDSLQAICSDQEKFKGLKVVHNLVPLYACPFSYFTELHLYFVASALCFVACFEV